VSGPEHVSSFEDLFAIEQSAGAGLKLWGGAVERQLERVKEANYRHRLHHTPNKSQHREDADAFSELQSEVYFLSLAIRRVVLFCDALGKQVSDPELHRARNRFRRLAGDSVALRDILEHLDEYLLDRPGKHIKAFAGRVSPVLISMWEYDNVFVAVGEGRIDITAAAQEAILLARAGVEVWERQIDLHRVEAESPMDDDVAQIIEVKSSVAAVIEGEDANSPRVQVGVLRDVRIREATEAEIPAEETDTEARASGD
jgi:hypothetical protein